MAFADRDFCLTLCHFINRRFTEFVQLYVPRNSVQCSYADLVLGRNTYYFVRKSYHSNKMLYEIYTIKILDLLICICVSWRVFNRQLTILWVPTVMLLSPNCSLIQMKQITNRDFSTKNNKGATLVFPFSKSTFLYIWCHFTKYFSTLGDYVDRIHSNELEIKDTTDTGWSVRYWQR